MLMWLRNRILMTLAGGMPVMMNITVRDGTVDLKDAKYVLMHRVSVISSTGAGFKFGAHS